MSRALHPAARLQERAETIGGARRPPAPSAGTGEGGGAALGVNRPGPGDQPLRASQSHDRSTTAGGWRSRDKVGGLLLHICPRRRGCEKRGALVPIVEYTSGLKNINVHTGVENQPHCMGAACTPTVSK